MRTTEVAKTTVELAENGRSCHANIAHTNTVALELDEMILFLQQY